jgi:VWFA-related protein
MRLDENPKAFGIWDLGFGIWDLPTTKRVLACLMIGLCLVTGVRAQRPSFRASISVVEVDAFVTDQTGAFVKDLTAADFELLEDGRPQAIRSFSLVDLPLPVPQPPSAGVPLESDVTTNAGAGDGRMWVLLLDGMGADHDRLTQNVARRFVDEALGPDDLAAVIYAHRSMRGSQPFTRNRSLLLASIEEFSHTAQPPTNFARSLLDLFTVMEDVSRTLGLLNGRRKAMVWIGGALPFDLSRIPNGNGLPDAYQSMVRTAQRNNVAIYPVDSEGLGARRITGQEALRGVADDTGGESIVNQNDFSAGYARFVRDSSTYYVLGYEPSPEPRDGKFHPISVRVKRPGLTVRSRKGYLAESAKLSAAAAETPTRVPPGPPARIGDALRNPIPSTALEISIAAVPFKGADNKSSVLLAAHVNANGAESGNGRVEIGYMAIDAEAKTLLNRKKEYDVALSAAGFDVVQRVDLPRGRQEIRFAARMPDGATGSVVTYVDVPDFSHRGPALSGLVVESARPAGGPLIGDAVGVDATKLTTERRFARSGSATVRGILYTDGRKGSVAPALDAVIRNVAGAIVVDSSRLPVRTADADVDQQAFSVSLPIADLKPGSYVLTIAARKAAGKSADAERQLMFWVAE